MFELNAAMVVPAPWLAMANQRTFDLHGGLLTRDTGQVPPDSYGEEELVAHGTLTSYRISSGKRRSWNLPRPVATGGTTAVPRGDFGYSTHTANTVFWIALRTLAGSPIPHVETSTVYAARLR